MKKLTAGIFAGILTIVTVNAADAAIATKAYVDQERDAVKGMVGTLTNLETSNTTSTVAAINEVKGAVDTNKSDITQLKTDVSGNTSSISDLKTKVDGLAGSGTGSVADQIAGVLGEGFTTDNTVKDALDLKADKAQLGNGFTADNTVEKAINNITAENTGLIDTKISAAVNEINTTTGGLETRLTTAEGKITTNTNAITTLNGDGEGSVNKKIETAIAGVNSAAEALAGRVSTNESAIATLNGDGEGSVAKALADAKEYANGLNDTMDGRVTANESSIAKLDGADTVEGSVKKQIKDAIAGVDTKLEGKQNLLNNDVNFSTTGEGNVVSSVSAVDGVVTATKGINAVTVPTSNTPSESGTYVLTATVENGTPTYYWENIQRATQSENQ